MWTREVLKDNAKEFLRKYLKVAVLVCLVYFGLSSVFSTDSSFVTIREKNSYIQEYEEENNVKFSVSLYNNQFLQSAKNVFTKDDIVLSDWMLGQHTFLLSKKAFAVVSVIFVLVNIFIMLPMSVGLKRFFIRGYKYDVKFNYLFSPFKDGTWNKIVGKLFLKNIYLFLWTLLLIIPGIVKSYQYYFVEYILAENPEMPLSDAIQISKEMTDDDKFSIFALEISFFGWALLASLLLNLGFILLNPYTEATYASLYITKKEIVRERYENLGGFVDPFYTENYADHYVEHFQEV